MRSVYHERSSDSLNGLHLTDRGTLSIDATRFSYATSLTSPTIAADWLVSRWRRTSRHASTCRAMVGTSTTMSTRKLSDRGPNRPTRADADLPGAPSGGRPADLGPRCTRCKLPQHQVAAGDAEVGFRP